MNRQLNIIISKLKPTRNTSVQGIDALKYAWPALRLTLTTFEKILDGVPIPGLKGAIGGFLELVKNEETLIQNSEDILGIQKQIMDLACIFKQWDGIHKLPQELEPRIQTFIDNLSAISTQCHDLKLRNPLRRYFTAVDDAAKLSRILRDLEQLVRMFQLDITVTIEVALYSGIHAIQNTIKEDRVLYMKALTDAMRNANSGDPILSLPRAKKARFDANTQQDDLGRTHVDILGHIDNWITNDVPWIFILQGRPQSGKSAIARTVCKKLTERGWLGASFFVSRDEASCNNPFLVFPTIAYQLAMQYPKFRRTLTKILQKDPDIVGLAPEIQLEKLVIEPMCKAADEIGTTPVMVVIDGLDKCSSYRAHLLSLLCTMHLKLPVSFKLFISFRPKPDLNNLISSEDTYEVAQPFILCDLDTSIVYGNIENFLHLRLSKVPASYRINPRFWSSTEDITTLAIQRIVWLILETQTPPNNAANPCDPVMLLDWVKAADVLRVAASEGNGQDSIVPSIPGREGITGPNHASAILARKNILKESFGPSVQAYKTYGYDTKKCVRITADIMGTGKADLVSFRPDGVWNAINNGDGTFQPSNLVLGDFGYSQGWRIDKHPRFVADITGDGRADILGFGDAGVLISLNRGDGTFKSQSLALADFGYHAGSWRNDRHLLFLADANNDGLVDIYGFGDGCVFVGINNILVDGTFKPPVALINNFGYNQGWRTDMHPRFIADLTGDGTGDIIGFGYAGVYVAVNDGQGNFSPAKRVLPFFGCNVDAGGWRVGCHLRMVADMTGNGRGDIVGFGDKGVSISINLGDGTFGSPRLVLPCFGYNDNAGAWRVDQHPRFLADLSGDGRCDVIGFGDDGVYISINNGDGNFGLVHKIAI